MRKNLLTLLIMIYALMLVFPVFALSADKVIATPTKPHEAKSQGSPVVLGDQILFTIKGDIKGYSAEERAKTISERIKGIAEDPNISIESLTTSNFDLPLTQITVGDKMLLVVLDQDAVGEGRTRQELALDYSQKLRTAIEKYRQDYSLKRRLTGLVYTLIATLVLITILYFLNKLYHKAETKTEAWLNSKKVHIGIQSFELVRAERLRVILIAAVKTTRIFIFLVVLYTYLHLGLSFFPRTEAFAGGLSNYIFALLRTIGMAVWAQVPNLLFVAMITFITHYILKVMRFFFKGVENETITFKGFYPEWGQPTYRICRVLVIAFAAVIAFPYIPGSNSPAFKGISIFFGILFSLGSSSAVANILAGYTITYRRIFKIGDRIKIADFVGDVIETRLQVIHLRTIKNEEIVVPSSMIVNSHVINYSTLAKEKGLILHTTVTIGYDTPWRQVEALLLVAADRTPGLLRDPGPFVLQKSLDDFYVAYELNVYTDVPQRMAQIYTELHRNIQDAFNEYGVQIMSPSYRSDPDRPKVVPKEQWYAPPAKPPGDSEH